MAINKYTKLTGNQIRKSFIDFFTEKADHTFVRSSSLVPGGDSTLLFTNAGMVQFKDIFLGIEKRSYSRAVNSQKCLRVAGKHNDLEDVGQDDTHHTFFEMLGNWSFGDYYKKEAISWAWELLTDVWGIPKNLLFATVFKDEKGEIPSDEEAATLWRSQPGFIPDHLFYLGRKDNFWEMADTGPCGPCSEIHIDLDPNSGPVTAETIDTDRFIELWNLVFIIYNRTSPTNLIPLPSTHIDTGLGFERIVNILQGSGSNYRTDLFWPLVQTIKEISNQSDEEVEENFSPYRVIADHGRAATFLIADGVIPGNLGRNYICRMIIRRAFRFAGEIGITEPFIKEVAATVIDLYGEAYPELISNQDIILETITKEEEQFQHTLDKATHHLNQILDVLKEEERDCVSGFQAADLYTTYGLPFEITRDIVMEQGFNVDEAGFIKAMDEHRQASGAGQVMGNLGGEDAELFDKIRDDLVANKKLPDGQVIYEPYGKPSRLTIENEVIAIVLKQELVDSAREGDDIEIILPKTNFYIESGGQVSDEGWLSSSPVNDYEQTKKTVTNDLDSPGFKIKISGVRRPSPGIITHIGKVTEGKISVGDRVFTQVDNQRRLDIMRNHTATHLLHSALRSVLGKHARQAGSLVAPDRLRFDFNHPEALTQGQINKIEAFVNEKILSDNELTITNKSLEEALKGGAVALFGERYDDIVRNIIIGGEKPYSNELCGGTHVDKTGDIGTFIILSEASTASGIRRIEAVTGRESYKYIQHQLGIIDEVSSYLGVSPNKLLEKSKTMIAEMKKMRNKIDQLNETLATKDISSFMEQTVVIEGVNLLTAKVENVEIKTLRQMADRFREQYPKHGVVVLTSIINKKPIIIAGVTQDLVSQDIKAGDLVNFVAKTLGGGGGGKPTLAQAGGNNPEKIDEALNSVAGWIKQKIE